MKGVTLAEIAGLPDLDYNVIPFSCTMEFLRGHVMLIRFGDLGCGKGRTHERVKFFVGRTSPEEVAYKIAQGQLAAPASLVSSTQALILANAFRWECNLPVAGSGPRLVRERIWCQVKLTDLVVSYARKIAGAPFVTDNIAGLNLGQEVVA